MCFDFDGRQTVSPDVERLLSVQYDQIIETTTFLLYFTLHKINSMVSSRLNVTLALHSF